VRVALVCALAVMWLNFALTTRWAHVDGSINGPKRPFFFVALLAASVFAIWALRDRQPDRRMSRAAARALAVAGLLFLGYCFVCWFPLSTWRQIPFLDDWPIRYQGAHDMMRLLSSGAFTGWEWRFHGGYHSSSDATQGLGTLTFLPMRILGPTLGFHVAHVLLFLALPVLVWRDLSLEESQDDRVTAVAVGLVCLFATGYSYFLIRSGDTNSIGGVVMAMTTIAGAHAARRGRRWGAWVLVCGLALTAYAHPGFFVYACIYVILDAVVARDRRSLERALIAIASGAIASLPLTWESWRYPSFFSFNTLFYEPPHSIDWGALVRTLYYNVELLWLPGRWFNDYSGLALVFVPVAVALAIVDRSRVRFHAIALLVTLAVMRLNNVYAGYLFLRPIHMLVVFSAPVLAALLVRYTSSAWLRWSLVAVLALYVQVWFHAVPHVADVRDFNPGLIDRITRAPGALVLLEANPHRNMNAEPGGTTEPSRFGTHFEPLIAERTGRRLYSSGYADGWSWSPWKGQVVGGGTFMGRSIAATPPDAFVSELHRWGVVDAFVWSETTSSYLAKDPRFEAIWSDGTWTQYRLHPSDPREVATETGSGALGNVGPHGADVILTGVRLGDLVSVRTNFHPAWTARANGRPVPLVTRDGQLAFAAPCTGDCIVSIEYPAHRGFIPLALAAVVAAGLWTGRRAGLPAKPHSRPTPSASATRLM
jgi:hypothetical protein